MSAPWRAGQIGGDISRQQQHGERDSKGCSLLLVIVSLLSGLDPVMDLVYHAN